MRPQYELIFVLVLVLALVVAADDFLLLLFPLDAKPDEALGG